MSECVSKSLRTGRLERERQMAQLSATRCSCIAILWVSLVSSAAITLYVASQQVIPKVSIYFVIDSVRKLLDTPSYYRAVRLKDRAKNVNHDTGKQPGTLSPVIFRLINITNEAQETELWWHVNSATNFTLTFFPPFNMLTVPNNRCSWFGFKHIINILLTSSSPSLSECNETCRPLLRVLAI